MKVFSFLEFVNESSNLGSETEKKIIDLLSNWLNYADEKATQELYLYRDTINQAKEKSPHIFKPSTPNGTSLYRGLLKYNGSPSNAYIIRDILRESKVINPSTGRINTKIYSDIFEELVFGGMTYLKYKKPIEYTPHKQIQSWTDDFFIAWDSFSKNFVLETKQDNDFFFNQQYINKMFRSGVGTKNENEVIHFGSEYKNPVYFIFDKDDIERQIKFVSSELGLP